MITRDDWLSAVKAAGIEVVRADPNALTLKEFAALIGLSRARAEDRMRELVASGVAVRVRKMVLRTDGASYPVPAYVLKQKAAPKRKR